MGKRMINRKFRSIACANIILDYNLFDEYRVFAYAHPKIKSQYRLANLFLLHKKMLYKPVDNMRWQVNCDNLLDFYYA